MPSQTESTRLTSLGRARRKRPLSGPGGPAWDVPGRPFPTVGTTHTRVAGRYTGREMPGGWSPGVSRRVGVRLGGGEGQDAAGQGGTCQ